MFMAIQRKTVYLLLAAAATLLLLGAPLAPVHADCEQSTATCSG